MKLSVVVPLLNEEESLKILFEKIKSVATEQKYELEVIFVDDGSTDNSLSVLKGLHQEYPEEAKFLSFGKNNGKAAALRVGINAAVGDVIVTMDADLQDDPVAIPEMVSLLETEWDVVSGWKKKRLDPVFTKNLPSKFFNAVVSKMSGVKLHDFNCGFKAYRKEAAKSLDIYGERHRFLPALAFWNGFRVTETVVPHHARQFGKSKYGLDRFVNGFFDLATLLFLRKYMTRPLHFFGLVGLLLVLLGFSILGYFSIEWFQSTFGGGGDFHLRPLIIFAVTSIIVGVQFFSVGLIGELLINTKGDKNFHIKEQAGIE